MAVKKGQIIEVEISDVAFGGKGVAKVDGFVVFVEQAIPGDVVSARVVKKKKNHAIARIDTLIEPSTFRIPAPCRYSGYCGGCKWQFLAYEKQLEYKRRHVIDAIERIGLIIDVKVNATIPSERIYEYRNKMEFSCSDKRWLLPADFEDADVKDQFALGLHVPGTFQKVIDIGECLLQPHLGNKILGDLRTFIQDSGVPVYGLRSHVGFWRFVMLRHSAAFDQWMVNIITADESPDLLKPMADQLVDRYPQIVSIVNNVTSRKSSVAIGEYEILLAGMPTLKERIGEYEFEISANSFFQTNTLGAERLYEIVEAYAGLTGTESVLDLYCGTGTITIHLSKSAKRVVGLEITASSVEDARKNCRINTISNCDFIVGDVKEKLAVLDWKPDVMVIDPPRAGMHKNVVGKIMDLAPERIVYVSCNPATLARDLGILKDAYTLAAVQPLDMFPHTHHIETVVKLERTAAGGQRSEGR